MGKHSMKVSKEFLEEVRAMSALDMQAKIVELYKNMEAVQEAQKEDPDIQSLREQLKVANEGYRTKIKDLKSKIKYLLQILNQNEKEKK